MNKISPNQCTVCHNDAMKTVETVSQNPDFGTMSKMGIVYNVKGQTTVTYVLNKRLLSFQERLFWMSLKLTLLSFQHRKFEQPAGLRSAFRTI